MEALPRDVPGQDLSVWVPCAVCGSMQTQPIVKKFGHFIARCVNCGLVYANPRMPASSILSRYSPEYFRSEYLPAQGVSAGVYDLDQFDARYRPLLMLINQHTSSGGSMLEIGAGAGFFLKSAERVGWRVQGVEISDEAISFAHHELHLNITRGFAEELDFPAGSLDVVVMLDVIEHLFEPRRVLDGIWRALRPQGLLLITTPNLNALSHTALGNSWAVLSPGEHLYYFTDRTLEALLRRTGFERIEFCRQYAGWGVWETMNPCYTHALKSLRTRLYLWSVALVGPHVYRWILARGRGDTLLCTARRGP